MMENFKLEVYFHAESQEDAIEQAQAALVGFDDGFEEAWLNRTGQEPFLVPDPAEQPQ